MLLLALTLMSRSASWAMSQHLSGRIDESGGLIIDLARRGSRLRIAIERQQQAVELAVEDRATMAARPSAIDSSSRRD